MLDTLVYFKCHTEVSWIDENSQQKQVAFKQGELYLFTKMTGAKWYRCVNELGTEHVLLAEGEDGIYNWFELAE